MSQTMVVGEPEVYTVVREVNDHGAATVRGDNGSTYHVAAYADEMLRAYLADLRAGDRVRMDLVRAGVRANVWKVSALYSGEPITESNR
ncbi:hypothetical protein [Haloferax elongans]|nr:hypothetical protein [Haloferax elongans]